MKKPAASNEIHISAAIVIDDKSRILLVRKRGTRFFMQPGGKLEAGETLEQCVCREIEEEIGRQYDVSALSPVGQFTCQVANEPDTKLVADLFVIYDSFTPTLSREIEEAVWVSLIETPHIELAPLTKDIVFPLARKLALNQQKRMCGRPLCVKRF